MVPKIFYVTEKAWNYYPFTITEYSVSTYKRKYVKNLSFWNIYFWGFLVIFQTLNRRNDFDRTIFLGLNAHTR